MPYLDIEVIHREYKIFLYICAYSSAYLHTFWKYVQDVSCHNFFLTLNVEHGTFKPETGYWITNIYWKF